MIYFIRCGQHVKIGVSARPWDRLAEFQTANPEPLEMLAVAPGDFGFESELHRLFGEHRGVGEWFRDNERIQSVVAFMHETFPELQASPAISSVVAAPQDEPQGTSQTDDEWRTERRTYTKQDGSISVYHNYRRRHLEYTEDGKRRIPYRRANDIPDDLDYGPDELPSGPRTWEELATMATRTWRIETNANGNGREGSTTTWGWRRRGPVREYRYGGVVVALSVTAQAAANPNGDNQND